MVPHFQIELVGKSKRELVFVALLEVKVNFLPQERANQIILKEHVRIGEILVLTTSFG